MKVDHALVAVLNSRLRDKKAKKFYFSLKKLRDWDYFLIRMTNNTTHFGTILTLNLDTDLDVLTRSG